jgi:hypothetical protein
VQLKRVPVLGTHSGIVINDEHSPLMLASRITRPYSSYCLRRKAAKSAPHIPTG